jgi:hypothetical protein
MVQKEAELNLVRLTTKLAFQAKTKTTKLAAFLMIDQLRFAFGTRLISLMRGSCSFYYSSVHSAVEVGT